MATICTHCGREVPPGNTVCQACGETVPFRCPSLHAGPGARCPDPSRLRAICHPLRHTSSASQIRRSPQDHPHRRRRLRPSRCSGCRGCRCHRLARHEAVSNSIVHKNSNGDVTINTPGGAITSGSASTISESDLGVALYPGATRGEGSMNMHTPFGSLISAVFLTSDSPTQVVDFYKSKLGRRRLLHAKWQLDHPHRRGRQQEQGHGHGHPVDSGKTRINILHTTKK